MVNEVGHKEGGYFESPLIWRCTERLVMTQSGHRWRPDSNETNGLQ